MKTYSSLNVDESASSEVISMGMQRIVGEWGLEQPGVSPNDVARRLTKDWEHFAMADLVIEHALHRAKASGRLQPTKRGRSVEKSVRFVATVA
jgi:hypothetical protein